MCYAIPGGELCIFSMKNKKRILITGKKGAGKTTLCGQLAKLAREVDWEVKGVISPAVFEEEHKVGIDLVNTLTKERRRLANLAQPSDQTRTPRWGFREDVITWGNEILAASTACDLFFVDELGPLELVRGEGLLKGLTAIDSGNYHAAIIVIRSSLLPLALKRWPNAEVIEVLTPNQVPTLAEYLEEAILSKKGLTSLP